MLLAVRDTVVVAVVVANGKIFEHSNEHSKTLKNYNNKKCKNKQLNDPNRFKRDWFKFRQSCKYFEAKN